MNSENKIVNPKDAFWQLVIVILLATAFVIGASLIVKSITIKSNKQEVEEIVKEVIREKKILITQPQCERKLLAYEFLKENGQLIRLVEKRSSYASYGNFVGNINSTIHISGNGEVACGYLYIRVSKSGKSLNEKWDSIYVNPHGFGGHLLRSKSIIKSENNSFTEVLFLLDAISYLPGLPYSPEAQNFKIADWVNLLNVNSEIKFNIGLSAEDIGGLIEEISIAYKCWNPATGDETQNCQLSLE